MLDLLKKANKAPIFILSVLGVANLALAQTTAAGSWPTQKPIRLIAVFLPGGSGGSYLGSSTAI